MDFGKVVFHTSSVLYFDVTLHCRGSAISHNPLVQRALHRYVSDSLVPNGALCLAPKLVW